MLTPGEVVMNKQASQTYRPLLSHLNAISGGVAFATGGLVPGQGNARIDYGPHKRLDEQPVMCIEEMVSLMYASE